jgi:hypothetical protein
VKREVAVRVTRHARVLPRRHWLMRMLVVPLQQAVGRGMTIQAARVREHLGRLDKKGA